MNILITLEGDLLIDNPKKAGLSQLTAMLLNESTENTTTEQMSAKLDNLGSSISFNSGKEHLRFCSSLVGKIDETISLLEEKLFNPAFDEDDYKRINKQYKSLLITVEVSKIARQAVAELMYVILLEVLCHRSRS